MSVIDLCSSDEDDEPSPPKSALSSFAPRKEKFTGTGSTSGQNGSVGKADGPQRPQQSHSNNGTPRAQQAQPNVFLPARANGHSVGFVNGSVGDSSYNVSHIPRASEETRQNNSNGERRGSHHNGSPGGASLAALLAGVAANDNASLEQLRSSMGKRGFGSPQAEQRSSGGIDKDQRYKDRRVSQVPVRENAVHKAQPRKSDAQVVLKQPLQRSAAAGPGSGDTSGRPWSGSNPSPISAGKPASIPQRPDFIPRANTSNEDSYSGAGLMTVAAAPGVTGVQQNFKRTVASIDPYQAIEAAIKRRRTDDGANAAQKSFKVTDIDPKTRPSSVDKTDPFGERVSYSDEPDLPAPRPFQRTVTSIPRSAADLPRAVSTVAKSSLDKELEAQIAINAATLRTSDSDHSLSTTRDDAPVVSPAGLVTAATGKRNAPYTIEDRRLLKRLKEVDGLSWDEIISYFPGRSLGSVQVHYSTKVKGQRLEPAQNVPTRPQRIAPPVVRPTVPKQNIRKPSPEQRAAPVRKRGARVGGPSAIDGLVSWASVRNAGREIIESAATAMKDGDMSHPNYLLKQDLIHPNSASRALRMRELGLTGMRAWGTSVRGVTEELKNHVVKSHSIQKQYHGTSGDVVALSWSANDDRFVAGSIAISDATSMQYNMSRNLLIGDAKGGELRELVEHHVHRPLVDNEKNVNGLHAMRETQDPRLFLTVTAAGFSPKGDRLYTAGTDQHLRMYATKKDLSGVTCKYAVPHTASVDLLSVRANSAVATGCHAASSCVKVFNCSRWDFSERISFSPSRSNLDVSVPIYPSALKWGQAHHHSNYLLAGFAGDEEKAHAGETCLWDVTTGQSVDLRTATRNVFDVAWNPFPSSASVAFAVAALSTGTQVSKGTRSVVHLFAPNQQYARRVKTLECRARDLNDVVFCPHDDKLVATGSADGTVYIWDLRASVDVPLHTLNHGSSVLVEDSPDTGVRFLSWGATASRLYSGSSDGIVKVWNPYRSSDNTHIEDIAAPSHQRSAVMSAAFNSDYRELLVGTENGRIDLFSIGGQTRAKPQHFKLHTAPPPRQKRQEPFEAARSLLATGQIELRPCGSMPFRQAVQGPNYSGPFLAPPADETMQAEATYQDALTAQHEASMKSAARMADPGDDEDLLKASKKVHEAQRTIDDLQERLEHFTFAQPKAEQFQRSLLRAEEAHNVLTALAHDTAPCSLECNFLPSADEREDSGRSELRIPGTLRAMDLNAARAKDEELDDACAMCFPRNILVMNKHPVRIHCASCSLKRANLNTTCSRCSAPARAEIDKTKPTLCERCSFPCFRCGQTANLETNPDGVNVVTCPHCALVWEADVLGYKLVSSTGRGQIRRRLSPEGFPDRIGRHWDGFADDEREHYASLWEETPQDQWL
ncbi:Rik1-associated factor 1 [Fulvia fulva]|nr:Rik1-associated factor 1 [Fulvia fulva]